MRIVQRGSRDLAIFYLVGNHLDSELRACLPGTTIVAFDDQGSSPIEVARAIGFDRVRNLIACGFSAGCQAVRKAIISEQLPPHDRLGVVCIDGTHASLPPERWQLEWLTRLGEDAQRGDKLLVATCTANTYTAKLPKPFMPTLAVLRQTLEPTLFPADPPHYVTGRDLHVYAYASAEIDKQAHIDQQVKVLPEMLRKHVRPWLERARETVPGVTCSGLRALKVAQGYVGWRETGPNRGDLVRRSLAGCVRDGRLLGIREGVAWCAGFVGLCDSEGGAPNTWRAAVRELVEDARANGTWRNVDDYQPNPGDLAIFMRDGKDPRRGEEGHVDRIESRRGILVTSIGGNVGDAVTRRTWTIGMQEPGDELVGWIVRTEQLDLAASQARMVNELRNAMHSS